jgi:uncharacterized protein
MAERANENPEVLRRAAEAWNRGDLDELIACIHPDVVWEENSEGFTGMDPVYRGHEGFAKWHRQLLEVFEEFRVETDKLVDRGDRLLCITHVSGRGRGSGVEVDMRVWETYTFREGRIVGREVFRDRSEAFAAAGIEEQE